MGGDLAAVDGVRLERLPSDDPARGVQAESLVEDPSRVDEGRDVLGRGVSPLQDLVELRVQPAPRLLVLGEEEPGPAERVGRGVEARQEEVAHLTEKILVRRRFPGGGIDGVEQDGEHVRPSVVVREPRLDDLLGQCLERFLAPLVTRAQRRRQDVGRRQHRGELQRAFADLQAEQSLQGDPQDERAHLHGDVEALPPRSQDAPAPQHVERRFDDVPAVGRHAIPVEGPLHPPPARAPLRMIDREHAGADHVPSELAERRLLPVSRPVIDQRALHDAGVVRQECGLRHRAVRHEITLGTGEREHEVERRHVRRSAAATGGRRG